MYISEYVCVKYITISKYVCGCEMKHQMSNSEDCLTGFPVSNSG